LPDLLYPRDEKRRSEEDRLIEGIITEVMRGEVVSNIEVKRLTKVGKEIITSMTVSPLRDAEGKIIGTTRICKDITQLKKARNGSSLPND